MLYYESSSKTWRNTFWFGVPLQKCALDLWIYQEIITQVKPELIVETGTWKGGSALFMANMCDLAGSGEVITIDISPCPDGAIRPEHQRITYLLGSSTSPEIINRVQERRSRVDSCLVVLDSDHSKEHVLNELRLYSHLVSKDSYLIVEDTNINGHPVLEKFGPGPLEAVQAFLAENADFLPDRDMEKFYLTFNPNGFLKRIR
jgi:cephalosporin hydroxylase